MADTNRDCQEPMARLLAGPRGIVNLGLECFVGALRSLGVPVVHVEWRPPAEGDAELLSLLAALEDRASPGDTGAAPRA